MSWSTESSQISVGDDVYGSDGEKLGTVAEVQSRYIVVEKGFFFPTDYYIPMSAVSSASGGQIKLNVAKDAALNSGWDTVLDTGTVLTEADLTPTDRYSAGGQTERGAYEVAAGDGACASRSWRKSSPPRSARQKPVQPASRSGSSKRTACWRFPLRTSRFGWSDALSIARLARARRKRSRKSSSKCR